MLSSTVRNAASQLFGGAVTLAIIVLAWPSLPDTLGAQKEPGPPEGARPDAPIPDEKQALADFLDTYRLAPGQNLKRIPPPRPAGIRAWYRRRNPRRPERVNDARAMVFGWRDPDRLEIRATMFGGREGWAIGHLPRWLGLDLDSLDIEGDPELLATEVGGDWIVRDGVPPEQLIRPLEGILQRALRRRISLELRQVERDVVVARGRYRPSPLPGHAAGEVEIYARQVIRDEDAASGAGNFPSFLDAVARWNGRRIVNEAESSPELRLSWRYNERKPPTPQTRLEDHDERPTLDHLQEQTGLTFTREKRPVRILFVEQARPAR
jgi:hypothetical protein